MNTFYKNPNINNPTIKPDVTNVEDVRQSIQILLSVRPGEKLFDPEYGIFTEDVLFDLVDPLSAAQLFNEIVQKVRRYEPRVELNLQLSKVTEDVDNNRYDVALYFSIKGFEGDVYKVTDNISR